MIWCVSQGKPKIEEITKQHANEFIAQVKKCLESVSVSNH